MEIICWRYLEGWDGEVLYHGTNEKIRNQIKFEMWRQVRISSYYYPSNKLDHYSLDLPF
jgi:hypothetical protein